MRLLYACLFLLFASPLLAQQAVFTGAPLKSHPHPELDAHFTAYEIYEIDLNLIHDYVKEGFGRRSFDLRLGDELNWAFDIQVHDIRSPNFVLRERTPQGDRFLPKGEATTYRGSLLNQPNSDIRLSIDADFFFGYVQSGKKTWYFEPLHSLIPGAAKDRLIVYEKSQVIPHPENPSAFTETQKHLKDLSATPTKALGQCYAVQLALMADGFMFDKHGSTPACATRMIGVTNLVNGNYDVFDDIITFVVSEVYVVSLPSLDPWPPAMTTADFVANFSGWAPTGFLFPHDMGQLWTSRNIFEIGGSTEDPVCDQPHNAYNVVYDQLDLFVDPDFLRRSSAHVIGHHFGAVDDPGGSNTIMAPDYLNVATVWSEESILDINDFLLGITCLQTCVDNPEIPSFTSNINVLCPGSMVTFYDQSFGEPTSWSWSFPGGNPSTSDNPNPTVTYDQPGSYSVTLTIGSPNGPQTITIPGFITVSPGGGSDFFHLQGFESGLNGWTIDNPDNELTWSIAQVPTARQGDGLVMFMDNAAYDGLNNRDALISPVFDFSGRDMVTLEFDHAYAQRTAQNIDSLIVYVSTDGGATYPDRVFTGFESGLSGNLATRPFLPQLFFPLLDTDWCFAGNSGVSCLSIDLSDYAQTPNIRIKIENVSNYGNTLYLDNIRLVSDCYEPIPPIAAFSSSPTEGCIPLTVQFIDESENLPLSWVWNFPGGIPSVSNIPNPTVTYSAPGTYDVTLTVTNAAGTNSVTLEDYVVVDAPPVAGFTYMIDGDVVNFTSTSSPNATSFFWDFGDGNTSTEENPTHTYAEDGFYVVTLTVSNICSSSTFVSGVPFVLPPEAGFSADPEEGCLPLTVQFIDESSDNTSAWQWEFPGGDPATSMEQSPEVTYADPGTYDVTLIVSNAVGTDTLTMTDFITVNPGPIADFSASINESTVDLTNNSVDADSLYWDFGDGIGNSNDTDPSYTYPEDGAYLISLIAINECGADTATLEVEILTLPTADFQVDTTSGCAPLVVTFTNLSSDNSLTYQWEFPGGDPASSTDTNPVVTYNDPGTFSVTLISSNDSGSDTLTLQDLIVVEDIPTAAFTSITTGLTVDFTNNTVNGISYDWDFGDGNGSTDTDPSHTYTIDGVYDVTLIAINDCGSDTLVQQVSAGEAPIANFSADPVEGCVPLEVTFTDQSVNAVDSREWSFPGGTPASSTEQNPVVVYDTPGTYDVTLSVTNALGTSTLTETAIIVVNDLPVAGFTSNSTGLTVDFTDTSTGADSYDWDFGDGNGSTVPSPSHTYDNDGVYSVTLIVTNDCGSDTLIQEVSAGEAPIADFTANPAEGCVPLEVTFTDQSLNTVDSWAWNFPGGTPASSTEQNPVVVYDTPGTYDVTLTVTNSLGSSSVTESEIVFVDDIPEAGFTFTVNGSEVSFTNTSVNANSFEWLLGDGSLSLENAPTYDYGTDGEYSVILIATNDCGSDTTSQIVTIVTPPSAGFSVTNNEGCAPLEVTFTDESSENVTDWFWEFPGGNPATSTEPNPVVTYATAGTYSVSLTVSNAAGDDLVTQTDIVVVDDVPDANYTFVTNGAEVTFTNTSQNANSFEWIFGDGNGSMDTDPVHTYGMDGTYTVLLIATNDCGSDTSSQTVVIGTPPQAIFTVENNNGCAPLEVSFFDASLGNVTAWAWEFPGGTPAISNAQNPVVTYTTAGTYDVTLTVSNMTGNGTATLSGVIVVDDVPEAGFTFTVNGDQVDFANTTTNASSYEWLFGNGETSTDVDPSETYSMDGEYEVSLIATNDCGSDTTTQTITIATPPAAGFTVDATEGCVPFTVQFSDASSENVTDWNWSFPGGTPASSTDPNPQVTYSAPGVYDVTLEVSNSAGTNTVTETGFIIVNDLPVASFTSITNGSQVDFTSTITGATDIVWDFGDGGMSMEENPTYDYPMDGEYEVTLTATNDCGSATVTETVVIFTQLPTVAFTTSQTEGCVPFTVTFENQTEGSATAYQWSFPGGTPATSTDENPTVTYAAVGQYDVTLIAQNSNGSDTLTLTDFISVDEEPTAEFTPTVNDNLVTFANLSVNADSYTWFFGDGNNSTDESPTHIYSQTGDFDISLVATNACGSDTFTVNVLIELSFPLAGFSSNVQEDCVPFTVQFFDESTNQPTEWNWSFPGGTPATSTEQNPVVTYEEAGVYSVSLSVSNLAGGNTIAQSGYITALDLPATGFSYFTNLDQVNFTNTTTGATSYFWDFGDGTSSTLISPTHTYAENGNYTVTLEATNACGTTTYSEEITLVISSVQGIEFIDRVVVYPNPNNGKFYLQLEGRELATQQLTVTVFSVLGQTILEQELAMQTNPITREFDLTHLPSGVYLLQLRAGDQYRYVRVVVE